VKINTKLLIAFVIIALIPLGVISILSYVNAKEALTRQVLSHLQSVAEIQSNRIESIVEQNLERLNLVSSRTQLRLSLDSFISNPNTDDQDRINQILLDARSSVNSFRDISVLTLDGEVVASTDATKIGGTRLTDEVFIRGQNENTADIFFLDENQNLCVYLSGPLYLEGELLGVVVIESTGDSILAAITDYTGLGTTGETQLAETDESGDAVFITPTRFDQGAALSRTVPKEEVNSPIIQALSKNEELFTDAVDYRGEPVLAATQYISNTGWGLVTKMDKAEALAPVGRLQYLLLMIGLLSLALVLLISMFLSRAIARPIIKLAHMATRVSEGDLSARAEVTSRDEIGILAQACNQMKDSLVKTNSELEQELTERKQAEVALRQSEERYRDLFDNANDLIQSISPDGHLLYVNKAWQEVLGYSKKEIANLKVWDIIHPDSMDHCVETFQKVMSGDNVSDIEAVFVAKNGSPIAVEGNAHSRFIDGKPISTQGIFRDISARKKAEERITHLNSLLRALRDVNQLITRESDRERLIQKSCDILVKTRGYEKAWILLVDEDKSPQSVAAAGSGDDIPNFMEQMGSGKYPSCVKQLWTQENPLLVYNNPGIQHKDCILADRHSNRGVYRCRLEYEGKVYGMLGVTIPSHALSDDEEEDLFLELCGDISFALAAIERREEHERAEEALQQSEARLAEAQRIAHIGSWELDLISNKLIWSDEAYRIFGLRPQQFGATYEAFLDNIHPDDREMVNKAYTESVETKTLYNIVHRLLLKDGTVKYVRERCETFSDGDGKPVRSIGTVQDVTERKLAEDALRNSEASLAEAQRIAHVGSWDWDITKDIISYSDEFHRIFGQKVRNFGMFLDSLHPDDRKVVEKSVKRALQGNKPYDIEYRIFLPNGEERSIHAQGEVTFDNTGKPIRMIGTVQDITEYKKMQEQLILTDRLASIGELAAGIAHELNNPLTGVVGFSQLLLDKEMPADIKQDVKVVYSEARRASQVVKNLLTFARKHAAAKEKVNINDIINKVLELRAYEQNLENIKINTRFDPELPEIMADYFQLQQVFLNIVINAEYFMKEAHHKGKLTITTERVNRKVRASFADDGPGIAREDLGHLFDPFFTTKEVGKGTGLGLSICHGIVAEHGGRIYVESELGKGATFIVELPIAAAERKGVRYEKTRCQRRQSAGG
jgi:PAS domain S-box-containing protein